MKRILVLAISLLSLCGCFKKPLRVAVIDSGISNVSGNILAGHNYIDDSDDTTDTHIRIRGQFSGYKLPIRLVR